MLHIEPQAWLMAQHAEAENLLNVIPGDFDTIAEETKHFMIRRMSRINLRKGDKLIEDGDTVRNVYFVQDGQFVVRRKVKLAVCGQHVYEADIALVGHRDIIHLVENGLYSAQVETTSAEVIPYAFLYPILTIVWTLNLPSIQGYMLLVAHQIFP